MPYEDFHELFYQAYLQATTDEGQKQAEAEEFQEQIEDAMDNPRRYSSMDMGLAIKNAVDNQNRNRRNQGDRRR